MTLLDSTWLYSTLPWHYHGSNHGSTWFYLKNASNKGCVVCKVKEIWSLAFTVNRGSLQLTNLVQRKQDTGALSWRGWSMEYFHDSNLHTYQPQGRQLVGCCYAVARDVVQSTLHSKRTRIGFMVALAAQTKVTGFDFQWLAVLSVCLTLLLHSIPFGKWGGLGMRLGVPKVLS